MEELAKGAPAWSALIQAISAIVAASALVFTGLQWRQSRRVAVFQSLQEFYKVIVERERALLEAKNDAEHKYAFEEFLNVLELYASALNHRMLKDPAKEFVFDKLLVSVAIIEEHLGGTGKAIEDHITSHTAYKDLRKLISANPGALQQRREALAKVPIRSV
jgi:hypothetical protein